MVRVDGLAGREHDRLSGGWLARELGLCYANVSLITDYDVGVPGDERRRSRGEAVLEVFRRNNLARVRELLFAVIPQVGAAPADDPCRAALPARGLRGFGGPSTVSEKVPGT